MKRMDDRLMEKIAEYNIVYQKEYGRSPSYRSIMRELNIPSISTVQRYVLALERAGRIKRTKIGNIATFPQLKNTGVTIIPLVGEIACGEPVEAVEKIEASYPLPKALFGDGELYMLRTFGDSMIDIGIHKDDLIIVRKQNYANNGDIVVALADGNNTLKRYYNRNGQVILHPENSEMKDIKPRECQIQGVLISCIKMY